MSAIYESPDGGKTVYARTPGSLDRILIYEDPTIIKARKRTDLLEKWERILAAAEFNPTLKDLLDQAETVYELIKYP